MMNVLETTLPGLATSLVIAVVTSLLTVRLALQRFRRERWWDRKAESYSRIVEALHGLVDFYEVSFDDHISHRERNEDQEAKMEAEFEQHRREVRKATGIGAFIISEKIAKVLSSLEKESHKNRREAQSSFEWYDSQTATFRKALLEVRRLAKEDLEVK